MQMNGFRPGVDQGLSAWTVQLEAKALGKAMGISRMTRITLSRPSETVKRLNGAEGIGCETSTSPRLITMN